MGELGILGEGDRVELLHGVVVVMSPIGSRHASCVRRLIRVFATLSPEADLSPQCPVGFEDSEPEPDMALLVPREDCYSERHPGPEDILLIAEVSDTSQLVDRKVKAPLYGTGGIREYWLVDLTEDLIEVYREPSQEGYRSMVKVSRGEALSPIAFPGFKVQTDDILP